MAHLVVGLSPLVADIHAAARHVLFVYGLRFREARQTVVTVE